MLWLKTCLLVSVLSASLAQEYLLSGDVRPRTYDLLLLYDLDPSTNFSFYGVVDILLTAKKPVSQLVLHAQNFSIPNNGIIVTGPEAPQVSSFFINDTWNFLVIELNNELTPNTNYTLTVPFYGNLKPGLAGVYISSYLDKNTVQKEYLVTTKFEPIHARKGFPCFDEPIYKATFRINIGHHATYTAISNMPLYNSTDDNLLEEYWPWSQINTTFKKDKEQFVWDRFEQSVPMSTYLVAFVISKFAYVESPSGLSNTTFRIWARKDAISQAAYAASLGPRVLSHFEKFFNVSFPLPKQDMIAIPDFASGAMENWGLITYRETALLYDEKESSFTNKERVAEVIAHELAHQWFGNLVTMKWWQDLWLNEGFATFAASIGVESVEPDWHADKNNAVDAILLLQNLDSLESSHPVSVPLSDPKRIKEIFDAISYKKGATLIRMMTMFLGQDVVRRAVHNYLVKYSYSNAEQDDLWRELTATSQEYGGLTRNVSVKQVMDTWTTQTGFPLLTVTRDYSDFTVTVSQKRYLNPGAKASTAVSWWVPLSVLCESEVGRRPDPVQWLADDEGVGTEHHRFQHRATPKEWILFNYDMIAPYRVNYDKYNWQLLAQTLASDQYSKVPELARVQLLSDASALAWSEHLDYATALQLVKYLQRESEYLPISAGLRALAKIEVVIKRLPEYGAFQKFVRLLIGDQYQRSGGLATKRILNPQDLTSVKMQTLLSTWACKVKYPGCEEHAVEMFQQWMEEDDPDTNNPIPLDLRETVYCVAVRRGSVREWRFMLERKQRANVASARDMAQTALTCTQEIWILNQYLEWCVSENSEVRRQDSTRVMSLITSSAVGYYAAKTFIYNRIDDLFKAFDGQISSIGKVVQPLLMQFTTQQELDEYLAWQEKNMKYLEGSKMAIDQGIEAAKVNIAWLSRNGKLVVDKMREHTAEPNQTQKLTGNSNVKTVQGNAANSQRPASVAVFIFTVLLLYRLNRIDRRISSARIARLQ